MIRSGGNSVIAPNAEEQSERDQARSAQLRSGTCPSNCPTMEPRLDLVEKRGWTKTPP